MIPCTSPITCYKLSGRASDPDYLVTGRSQVPLLFGETKIFSPSIPTNFIVFFSFNFDYYTLIVILCHGFSKTDYSPYTLQVSKRIPMIGQYC